jgi:hypothetical protein
MNFCLSKRPIATFNPSIALFARSSISAAVSLCCFEPSSAYFS